MADYDYFYNFDNFIGYTGDLQNYPTLYFVSEAYYGRITTAHPHADNVGRAAPKLLTGYSKTHILKADRDPVTGKAKRDPVTRQKILKRRLYERNTRLGKKHVSRNALVECLDAESRSKVESRVSQLIADNTAVKPKDDAASREPHPFVLKDIWQGPNPPT